MNRRQAKKTVYSRMYTKQRMDAIKGLEDHYLNRHLSPIKCLTNLNQHKD